MSISFTDLMGLQTGLTDIVQRRDPEKWKKTFLKCEWKPMKCIQKVYLLVHAAAGWFRTFQKRTWRFVFSRDQWAGPGPKCSEVQNLKGHQIKIKNNPWLIKYQNIKRQDPSLYLHDLKSDCLTHLMLSLAESYLFKNFWYFVYHEFFFWVNLFYIVH